MHFNCTRFFLTWSSCKCHSEGPEGNHGNVCSGGHRIASKCLSVFRYLTLYHKQTSDQEHGSDVFWLQVCSWVFRYPIQVAQTNTGFWSGCRSVGLPSFSLTCSFPFPVCVFMGVATSSSWDTPEVHQLITCSYKTLVSPPLQCQIVMSRSVITPVLLLTLSVLSQRSGFQGFVRFVFLLQCFFYGWTPSHARVFPSPRVQIPSVSLLSGASFTFRVIWLAVSCCCLFFRFLVRSFVPFTVVEDNFLIVITFITKCCDWEWLRPEKIRKEKCIWIQSLQHFLFCFWVHFTSVLCAKHVHPLLAS